MRSKEDLDGGDDLAFVVGSNGERVYANHGAVAGTTMSMFKSPAILQSPVIDDTNDNRLNFNPVAIPEDRDHDEQEQHPSPDVDDWEAPQDDQDVQQRLSSGPPPRPPPRRKY